MILNHSRCQGLAHTRTSAHSPIQFHIVLQPTVSILIYLMGQAIEKCRISWIYHRCFVVRPYLKYSNEPHTSWLIWNHDYHQLKSWERYFGKLFEKRNTWTISFLYLYFFYNKIYINLSCFKKNQWIGMYSVSSIYTYICIYAHIYMYI